MQQNREFSGLIGNEFPPAGKSSSPDPSRFKSEEETTDSWLFHLLPFEPLSQGVQIRSALPALLWSVLRQGRSPSPIRVAVPILNQIRTY